MQQINVLIRNAASEFEKNGIENSYEEAAILFEYASGLSKKDRIMKGITSADDETAQRFASLTGERLSGRPLQYIIGEWDFYGSSFLVGEGVLIPRPETEMLVKAADEFLKGRGKCKVLDLCAGSGCIGLTAALHNPQSEVFLIEKSEDAYGFLEKNKEKLSAVNAHILKGDVFDGPASASLNDFDVILSNPPYIASGEMSSLQSEVKREPSMALDGGSDGLDFYRCIAEKWLPVLRSGGLICFECGEEQTQQIALLLSDGCTNIKSHNDFNNLPRMVSALRR